eukprot:TRINITY_DN35985_c0_g1_i2.p1 TRINITY_DN35985_c0_g1~~TRINITY_DN35985_c0_g1_i2.p1  ORF type:complete len:225 (-),score=40.26 TRINITY_DN35985_c0_g1_i2:36-710(-)
MATIRFESSLQLDGSCSTPATVSLESSLEFGESPAGRDRLPSSPTRTPSRTRALSRCSSSPSSTFSVSSPKRSYDERLVCMVDASHTLAATRPASSDCWVPPRQPSKLYYRKALPWPLDKFHIEEHPDVAFKAHEEIYKLLPLGDERYRSRSNWHEVVAPGNATLQKKLAHQERGEHQVRIEVLGGLARLHTLLAHRPAHARTCEGGFDEAEDFRVMVSKPAFE